MLISAARAHQAIITTSAALLRPPSSRPSPSSSWLRIRLCSSSSSSTSTRAPATSATSGARVIKAAAKDDDDAHPPSGDTAARLSLYKDQDDTWVDRHAPAALQPYLKLARVDRAVGTWLLLWPCCWSTLLATPAGAWPDVQLMGLFGVGAFVMRGAGCTVNDLWDRDIDAKVERTKLRPLASGRVSPLQATAFLGCQLAVGLGVLLQLNTYTIALGAASLPLVVGYPLAKRYTNWPQLVLGLTFNWGALVGYAAVRGDLDLAVAGPLYVGSVCWTLVYDTLYAHQDRDDDQALGLKSTALHFGTDHTRTVLTIFALGAGGGWTAAGVASGLVPAMGAEGGAGGSLFCLGMAGCGGHLLWQVHSADLHDRTNLNRRFVSNTKLGAGVFASIAAGQALAAAVM